MNHWFRLALASTAVVSALVATEPAQADVFIKISDIKGESTIKWHEGEIAALSWSWGTSQARSSATGRASGKAQIADLVVSKALDSSSPKLAEAALTGKVLPEVVLTVTQPKAAGGGATWVKIRLTNVLVSSLKLVQSTGGSTVPSEELGLSFQAIEYSVSPVDRTGRLGSPVTIKYDAGGAKR